MTLPSGDLAPAAVDAFVLTRQSRDTRGGVLLDYWLSSARGPLRVQIADQSAVFFVPRDSPVQAGKRRAVALLAPNGQAVDAIYFQSQRALLRERDRLQLLASMPLEADVSPCERHLMERFITASCRVSGELIAQPGYLGAHQAELRPAEYQPTLRTLSLDIETDGLEGALFSIALVCDDTELVLMRGEGATPASTRLFPDEASLLRAFCDAVRALDPDLIIGWNVIDFDFAYLLRRAQELGVALDIGRDRSVPELTGGRQPRVRIAGRVVLDGIDTLLAASIHLESYSLQDVAEHYLGRGKAIAQSTGDKVAEIRRMFEHDRAALAHYNLEDCRLTRDIFARADLIGFVIERAQLTGLALDRRRGAVAAFDYLYLPRLHRAGYVARSVQVTQASEASPGGYVLDSLPGLHDNVIVLDFKSLYPSIIRTFCIDPLGLWAAGDDPIAGFAGATFDRERHILPELLTQLWRSRDEAKRRNDSARSYAIKILMNSFYGVLGTPACRFFDPKLVSSITLRGHEIITRSRGLLQARGWEVIYGDTDSLFLRLPAAHSGDACEQLGQELAATLNVFWRDAILQEHRLESQLEVEFDTHYLRFFMPTLRDSVQGSKKRYAGLTKTDAGMVVEFKGLEAVRTDWTPLARRFQRELYRRVFMDEPYVEYIRELSAQLMAGKHDTELVYRKRVRRDLDDYVKNVPPHVRAARHMANPTRIVRYCMTLNGPEPAEELRSALDYTHYLERQLMPAADTLLQHCGTSFARIIDRQLELF